MKYIDLSLYKSHDFYYSDIMCIVWGMFRIIEAF